ncbi:glucose dehydrogenase [FAD, quinone] isoform X2 [Folsomia candida]|uniref:glucose dehydrogenase [FAD, quinone] isoform X2 n=1 Tax=Folsomia candida TaxID=158441 RepID=UPI0016053A88|nr:glucose dehydrogenase [FAD, quinone] isoform X2 [Folsomia candida]
MTTISSQGILLNENQRDYYGISGPISVTSSTSQTLGIWLAPGRELGFQAADSNAFQIEGFAPLALSIKNGMKSSSYTGFIEGVEQTKPNLRALRYSQVQKILLNGDKVAYGVTYLRHGIPQIAHASREVIISAGAVLSPIMLMKSSIGPAKILQAAKIPIVQDLPGVGQNLMDHAAIHFKFQILNPSAVQALNPLVSDHAFEDAIIKFQSPVKTGPFVENSLHQAFVVSSRARRENEGHWPDYHLFFYTDLQSGLGTNATYIDINVEFGRPKSRGCVILNTDAYSSGETDDEKLVSLDLGSFTDPTDIDVLLEGLRLVFKIKETAPFQALNLKYLPDVPAPCKLHNFGSDEYWRCYIVQTSSSAWHFSGSCIMGRRDDPLAVVDSELKVRGVSQLRVVDASVLPTSTNGNTNAPTLLVAEKAACQILRDYLHPYSDPNFCPLDNPAYFKPFGK